jgi:hypothetical protein
MLYLLSFDLIIRNHSFSTPRDPLSMPYSVFFPGNLEYLNRLATPGENLEQNPWIQDLLLLLKKKPSACSYVWYGYPRNYRRFKLLFLNNPSRIGPVDADFRSCFTSKPFHNELPHYQQLYFA